MDKYEPIVFMSVMFAFVVFVVFVIAQSCASRASRESCIKKHQAQDTTIYESDIIKLYCDKCEGEIVIHDPFKVSCK